MPKVKANPTFGRFGVRFRDARGRFVSQISRAKSFELVTPRGRVLKSLFTKRTKLERAHEISNFIIEFDRKAVARRRAQSEKAVKPKAPVVEPGTIVARRKVYDKRIESRSLEGVYDIRIHEYNFNRWIKARFNTIPGILGLIEKLLWRSWKIAKKEGAAGWVFYAIIVHEGKWRNLNGKAKYQHGFSIPREEISTDEEAADFIIRFIEAYAASLREYLKRQLSEMFLIKKVVFEYLDPKAKLALKTRSKGKQKRVMGSRATKKAKR